MHCLEHAKNYSDIFHLMQDHAQIQPTFMMVGCQRCGTTWTDAALRNHSEIYLPVQKQSYFFDRNYDKGIEWYLERFQNAKKGDLVGEVATGYCLLEAVPLMHKHFPDIKLMMVMRNPIDRAYSNYQARKVEQSWTSFADALEKEPDLLTRGEYIDQIECLLKYYDTDQVLFLLYDDLYADDRAYLTSILRFLGVDDTVESNLYGQRKNAAMFPKLRKVLHRCGFKPVVNMISQSSVGDAIRRHRKRKGKSYSAMDHETMQSLQQHFHPFNERLGQFLRRDLSHWSNAES